MPLEVMEHVNIRAADMEATKDFYCDVLGMRVGERPPFDFPGYWIYLGDNVYTFQIKFYIKKNNDMVGK